MAGSGSDLEKCRTSPMRICGSDLIEHCAFIRSNAVPGVLTRHIPNPELSRPHIPLSGGQSASEMGFGRAHDVQLRGSGPCVPPRMLIGVRGPSVAWEAIYVAPF